jgi:hypothetical protein
MRKASSIFSGLGKLKAESQAFPIRTFAVMTMAVPKVLSKEMVSRLKFLDGVKLVMPPKSETLANMALEVESLLEKSAAGGSAEARDFLHDIAVVRNNPKITAVFVEGLPKKEDLAVYCSATIARLAGYDIINNKSFRVNNSIVKLRSSDFTPELDPHQDTPYSTDGKSKVDLLSVVGIESDGKAQTYVIEADAIRKKLSPRALEILSAPIYITNEHRDGILGRRLLREGDGFHFPVFKESEQGIVEMFLGSDFYGYDDRIKEFPEMDVKNSLNDLVDTINGMVEKGEVEKFNITTGTQLIIFNYRCLHGRVAALHRGETRAVDVIGYSRLAPEPERGGFRSS